LPRATRYHLSRISIYKGRGEGRQRVQTFTIVAAPHPDLLPASGEKEKKE
jgi:hypothetical protein